MAHAPDGELRPGFGSVRELRGRLLKAVAAFAVVLSATACGSGGAIETSPQATSEAPPATSQAAPSTAATPTKATAAMTYDAAEPGGS